MKTESAEPLLAKSVNKDLGSIPTYARLVPHLRAVERAGQTIVEVAGSQILEQVGLPSHPWAMRLRRALRTACLCHDLGKANESFQEMVRGKLDPKMQPARHELLSALILLDQEHPVSKWARGLLEEKDDIDVSDKLMHCVIGAVAGHHLKMDEEWTKAARAMKGGCGTTLKMLLTHPDLIPLLGDQRMNAETIYSLIEGEPNYLGLEQFPFSLSSRRWLCVLKDDLDWYRFAAVLKALLTAADVAGSALLPQLGQITIKKWIHDTLSRRVDSKQMLEVVDVRLNGNPPRSFQEAIGNSTARVTLVEAGCGTGKTAAAYLWAAKHAHGKKLFFCYPTTGTATEGFLGYVHETDIEADLVHSRAIVDLEGIATVSDDETNEQLLRIESLKLWGPQVIICTADTVLGLVRNNRRGLYNSPAILSGAFVFDELHAYDNTMFESVIALIAALPCASFLLMTASLSKVKKEFLLKRVQDVQEVLTPKELEDLPRYKFRRVATVDEALDYCASLVQDKKRVLWICNTVGCAQRILGQLKLQGIPARTYHSRFKYLDRVRLHRNLIRWFGRQKTKIGIVGVTTQVAEMSLDIDADLIVTELAPISAMIQRLGRLNRRVTTQSPGTPREALVLIPNAVLPYSKFELDAADEWVNALIDLNRPLSQSDLSKLFKERSSNQEDRWDVRTGWLDSGWFATPEPCRDLGSSVSVILSEDEEVCRKDVLERIRRIVPLNYDERMRTWRDLSGNLIAPPGEIVYDKRTGAKLLWK